jgi:hypothetical protein
MAGAIYVARSPALYILRAEGFEVRAFEPVFGSREPSEILIESGIGRVVTGTSDIDENSDLELWRAADKAGLPSICLLDRADEVAARFKKGSGEPVFPDFIAVANEVMRAEAISRGLPRNRLLVGGDLRKAHVLAACRRLGSNDRDVARRGWKAGKDHFCVLFASECGREAASAGRAQRFDEITALEELLAWSSSDSFCRDVSAGREPRIVIRTHPRDRAGKYAAWTSERVVLDNTERSAIPSILAADLVVGLESSLLEEALWVGTPALCLITISRKELFQ